MTAQPAINVDNLAIIYLRLSDFRDEDDGTFEAREAELREFAASLGLTVQWVAVENDLNGNGRSRGASAYKTPRKVTTPTGLITFRTDRPVFERVVRDLQRGVAGVLIVGDHSRISRNHRDGGDLLDACAVSGASAVAPDDDGRPRWILTRGGTDSERAAFQDRINDAYQYSADIAAKVRKGRKRWAGRSYQGGRRPFGFQVAPDTEQHHRNLILDETEAAELQKAARELLAGVSLKAVVRDLRERGVPTVTGSPWHTRSLTDALLKPATAGLALRGDELVPAPWPAILDRPTWERLGDLLRDPSRRTNSHRPGTEPCWLVSMFATCGQCRKVLRIGGSGTSRGPAYVGSECYHVRRNATKVDELVAEAVIAWLEQFAETDRLRPKPPTADTGVRALRTEARRLRARREQFRRLGATGDMDPADVAASLRDIDARLSETDARLADAVTEPDPLESFRDGNPRAAWNAATVARRRVLVQTLVESVVINRARRSGPVFDPEAIELNWKPAAGAPAKLGSVTA